MKLRLESIVNGPAGIKIAKALGRLIPPFIGHRLAYVLGARMASNPDSPQVRALRANLWVVSGQSLSREELDKEVTNTFRHTALCLYNLYHNINRPAAMLQMVENSTELIEFIQERNQAKTGLVIVGIHLSNFDFIAQLAAMQGFKALALAVPDPTEGYRRTNEMRQQAGWEIVPASMAAMRIAIKRLRAGGTVMSGIDRPFPESSYQPKFFGRPASLPVLHIQMAMMAKVPLMVMSSIMKPNGRYAVVASEPITLQMMEDKQLTILHNAEKILHIAEGFIRQARNQWSMFYPIWPEALEEMP